MGKIQVAIDGPVSSGKSTVGSKAALCLGYLFIDTGLMYRGLAYKIKNSGLQAEEDWGKIASSLRFEWKGDFSRPDLFLDGENVTGKLSSPEISSFTSRVAVLPDVRKCLVAFQQEMAKAGGVVMVGRDIGTVVLPNAELKIFLTASPDVRVERRYEELCEMGIQMSREELKKEILERDERDSTRSDSPLQMAHDGVEVDTSDLTIEEVVEKIVSLSRAREKRAERGCCM